MLCQLSGPRENAVQNLFSSRLFCQTRPRNDFNAIALILVCLLNIYTISNVSIAVVVVSCLGFLFTQQHKIALHYFVHISPWNSACDCGPIMQRFPDTFRTIPCIFVCILSPPSLVGHNFTNLNAVILAAVH